MIAEGIHNPNRTLSEDVVKVWTINEIIGNSIGFLVLGVLFYLDHRFLWWEWIGWLLLAVVIISIITAIWDVFIHPKLKYKHWRYEIDEEYLKLRHGAINETHQLVPMSKIQSVATKQGPLLRRYQLYALTIETMGSSHQIPALVKEEAFQLRDEIARFAKVTEEGE
ncbi:PH domain-containing protein [Bacillus hwajinpoensis]|uniref:PH domain-containing protein n=1 Tax=Guptibacillus hwajinpoensis TaxID=208199 RepID=A0A845F1D5_9BACL|nr:PH domain-containing protein [Pseudalkalibacillus hwajinpoensis]MYL64515.1 PH domain-containing protein [Pseudalkalibacillus hwajinpoensis]